MLIEFEKVRQEKNCFRRLFCSKNFDLYIWYNKKGGNIIGFKIVYMNDNVQKAFTWEIERGYMNNTVEGWDSSRFNKTPILIPDGIFCKNKLIFNIEKEMDNIEKEIKELVLQKIAEFP